MKKIIETDELKNHPKYKFAWISSWNKKIDPPTYIFEDTVFWMFLKQSDDNINTYIKFEEIKLPDNLIF